jgi:hypothetical protein
VGPFGCILVAYSVDLEKLDPQGQLLEAYIKLCIDIFNNQRTKMETDLAAH